jgi:hypothetical protein
MGSFVCTLVTCILRDKGNVIALGVVQTLYIFYLLLKQVTDTLV